LLQLPGNNILRTKEEKTSMGVAMNTPLTRAFEPSEGRTGELELLRGETRPLNTAAGFVIGGMICGLFWLVVAICYLVL
jgi:hypothetical protein